MGLIYDDLTYQIRKAVFYVHNHIGCGFNEEIYHQGLKLYFEKNGIFYKSKHRESLCHRSQLITTFECDFLVEDLVILELKAIQSNFSPDHSRQILEYLKFWNKRLGLLINFGFEKAIIKRMIYSKKEYAISENYDHLKNKLSDEERNELASVRKAILDVLQLHGLGYSEKIYYELLKAELTHKKIDWSTETEISVSFDGNFIRHFQLPFIVVDRKFLIGVKALGNEISSYDVARMMTYLRTSKMRLGLFLNFGKKQLEIRAIYYDGQTSLRR